MDMSEAIHSNILRLFFCWASHFNLHLHMCCIQYVVTITQKNENKEENKQLHPTLFLPKVLKNSALNGQTGVS